MTELSSFVLFGAQSCHEWMDVKDILHMPKLPRATLVLAEHRPETVSHAAALMRDHEAVFLEEPPDASFQQMLRGDLPVEDYVLTLRYMLRPDLPDPP